MSLGPDTTVCVIFSNKERTSVSPEFTGAGAGSVRGMVWGNYLSTVGFCRFSLMLTLLMPRKLLCSHPLLLVSKNTDSSHAKMRKTYCNAQKT